MGVGWGSGPTGTTMWGSGAFPPTPEPPEIEPIYPLEEATGVAQSTPVNIRLKDDNGIASASIFVSINGIYAIRGGVAVNGATFTKTANAYHGYDLAITPTSPFEDGSRAEIDVLVTDTEGVQSSKTYYFSVGVGPRLLLVRNPREGILLAHFNRPMLRDATFLFAGNWVVTPVDDGEPLTVVEVLSNAAQPDEALLRYTGGGSWYRLTVGPILSQEEDPLEYGYNTTLFEILFAEEPAPTVRLFNSVFGPLGISQSLRLRRTIDDHTANRSVALALDEQFRLRFQQLDNTVGRDGRPGKLRTT